LVVISVCAVTSPNLATTDACNQGGHLSEKPGNVKEFDSWQRNVRDFT